MRSSSWIGGRCKPWSSLIKHLARVGKLAERSCRPGWFHVFIRHRAGGMAVKIPRGRRARGERRSGLSLATIMGKKLDVPQSGKVGTTVNVSTRFGLVERGYVKPRDPKTPGQMRVRANLGHIASRWRWLTEAQRAAWTRGGREEETQRRLGRSTYLTGCQFYIKINCSRAALGLSQFSDPPQFVQFAPNPVEELIITNTNGVIALNLKVTSQPPELMVVLGAAPCSAGKSFVLHINILGWLPESEGRLCDFTALYVARYGVPPVGTRIVIQTRQHLNGWDDFPKEVSAVVPRA